MCRILNLASKASRIRLGACLLLIGQFLASSTHGYPGISKQAGLQSTSKIVTGFKTEPTFTPEQFEIAANPDESSNLTPGYILIDPILGGKGWGPQIYDLNGNLIWHGPSKFRSQNLHVCDYMGQYGSHLCYFHRGERVPMRATPRAFPPSLELPAHVEVPKLGYGRNVVLDNTYTPQGESFEVVQDELPMNSHAFQMLKGGRSFISAVNSPAIIDVSPYGGGQTVGWVGNQCIHEIDVATGVSIFHWCYLESGLEAWETYTFFESDLQHTNGTNEKVGDCTNDRPWDFLHFNAIDKTPDGDYYLSIRHLDQIIKIAGPQNTRVPPGTILWRLGGKSNQFRLENFSYAPPFSRQHDVRFVYTSGSTEVFSLFSNGWDGAMKPLQFSSEAQIIRIDTETMVARLDYRYPHPYGKLAGARGSAQYMGNGNVVVGWGEIPEITEFDRLGNVLYHASFTGRGIDGQFSYRARKAPWKGYPTESPKLVAYSKSCAALSHRARPITAYVSWNGATEVERWRFSTALDIDGPWSEAGTFTKDGFETQAALRNVIGTRRSKVFVSVEALDWNGDVLGNTTSQTFVPKLKFRSKCNARGCKPKRFHYTSENDMAWMCEIKDELAFVALVTFAIYIEAVTFFLQQLAGFQ